MFCVRAVVCGVISGEYVFAQGIVRLFYYEVSMFSVWVWGW